MYVALANLTNGGLSGGSRKYLEVVAPLLANHPAISRLDLFVPPQALSGLRSSVDLAWETWAPNDPHRGFRALSGELRKRRPAVVFIPSARWLNCGSPVVAMIRNMEPLAVPFAGNPWREAIRTLGRRWVAKGVCRKANRVIAVSDFVKDFLVDNWRLNSEKVATVYHGIDLPGNEDASRCPASLSHLASPFLFTAGSIRPYRHLEDAIEAMPLILSRHTGLKLVIGGEVEAAMRPYQNRLIQRAEAVGCATNVLWCGKLSQAEMSWCFRKCEAFLMTSRVEACPNTVLEAMANSCISVSTNSPPMPEMYGDTAFLYDAGNSAHLATQVTAALTLPLSERGTLKEAAHRRAAQFTWQKTVESTVAELVHAAGKVDSRNWLRPVA